MKTLTKQDIKNYQQSLKDFPHYGKAYMANTGETGLLNTTYRPLQCGCEVTGCGTLQFPLTVKLCNKHKFINLIFRCLR